jgi:hypothetical protein
MIYFSYSKGKENKRMYTWEIKNWLTINNNVFMSAQLFFEMMENSPQVTHIKLGRVFKDTFEMYITSNDGLNEKVLVVKNV